jgi:hypothetical protein
LKGEGKMGRVVIFILSLLGIAILLLGCSSYSPGEYNYMPFPVNIVISSTVVQAGKVVEMQAKSADPNEDDELTFTWSANEGLLSATKGEFVSWTAPQVQEDQVFTIRVQVSDGRRESFGKVNIMVTVEEPDICD